LFRKSYHGTCTVSPRLSRSTVSKSSSRLTQYGDSQSAASGGRWSSGRKKLSMLSWHTFTPRFSRYAFRRMAVVVLPEPDGPVRQTKGFLGCADKMEAAAELILSWNTSSQRRTNWVSFCMARMMSAISITRI